MRLALASALQRFPAEARADLARPLLQHAEDAADHNLPLMLWYGLIPLGDSDPGLLATLGGKAKIPGTVRCIAHRLAESIDHEPLAVDVLLGGALAGSPEMLAAVIDGLGDGLKKAASAPMPVAWEQVTAKLADTPDEKLHAKVLALDTLFSAGQQIADARRTVLDPKMLPDERRTALEQMMTAKAPALRETCTQLFPDLLMRFPAALVLTSLDDPRDTAPLLAQAQLFAEPERGLLFSALFSRPHHAAALLGAIAAKKLPRSMLTPPVAEKIRMLGDDDLTKKLDALPPAPSGPAKKRAAKPER